jgi:hypothetical protein
MAFNLSRAGKVTRISNAVAAGTTAVTSSAIDMKGFDSCQFVVFFGAITANAVTSVKAQQSSDDGSSDAYADLAGTSITVADDDDNQTVILDIDKPRERYLKCVVSRATQNAVVDGIFAIQYNAVEQPVTHDAATVVGSEFHHAPAEGTA